MDIDYKGIQYWLIVPEIVHVATGTSDELHNSSIRFVRMMLDFKV